MLSIGFPQQNLGGGRQEEGRRQGDRAEDHGWIMSRHVLCDVYYLVCYGAILFVLSVLLLPESVDFSE